jgi:outer membrane immunogenic protein
MRSLVAAIAAIAALSFIGGASAADMPVKASVYKAPSPAIVPYSWTGWYIGANVGYSWGKARSDIEIPNFVSALDSAHLNGVIGGGQFGYNWQIDPRWLVGFEADFQGSGERGSRTRIDPFGVGDNVVTAYEAKIEWFGTVRGRLGYIWDRVLLYATGGFAYGRVSLSGSTTINCAECFQVPTIVVPVSAADVSTGWTVGGGVEGAGWNPHWSWKLEYLYIDLGRLHTSTSFIGGPVNINTNFTDNILRIGLNYRVH